MTENRNLLIGLVGVLAHASLGVIGAIAAHSLPARAKPATTSK